MTDKFQNPLRELAEFEALSDALRKGQGPMMASGCMDSQKVHLMSSLRECADWTLVVTTDEQKAQEMAEDFRCFDRDVWYYPPRDLLFYSSDIHGNLITRRRIEVMRHLAEDSSGIVVTTIDALMERLLPLEHLMGETLTIRAGETLDITKTARQLSRLGYENTTQVEAGGQFALRGGILDVFPLTEEVPCRIELWGDEIDSIRSFDAESQRSIEELSEIVIFPASEVVLSDREIADGLVKIRAELDAKVEELRGAMKTQEAWRLKTTIGELTEGLEEGLAVHGLESLLSYFSGEMVSFREYFPEKRTSVWLDEPQHLRERAAAVELEFSQSMEARLLAGSILPGQASFLYGTEETMAGAAGGRTVLLTTLDLRLDIPVKKKFSFSVRNVSSYQNGFELLIGDLQKWKKDKYRVVLLAGSTARATRLAEDLREYELSAYCPDLTKAADPAAEAPAIVPGTIMVIPGNLHRGFEYSMLRFVVITESDMFGSVKRKKKRRRAAMNGKVIESFSQLSPGDYVVHENHGLGIYRGIEKIMTEEGQKDYIRIEYRDGGVLFVPATALERIQKYASSDAGKTPRISKLGGIEWKKTKSRVRTEVEAVAKDLVQLYADRQKLPGYQFAPDTPWQKEFEDSFPFEETEDQLTAIEDTKRDMESTKIMDRLICGDVGFGKTEIALRAAFKAVQEGKQAAFLVPTTILAQQHYNTFVQRLKDFPVNVEMLSRFRTAAEQKETIRKLKSGLVDIVVGTHRLLSQDVVFKNLGLLVVDEEQRFGVTHKEKIKKLRRNVDVLTLTATPIPRTLHMSLAGIRDMSVLEEPPVDRRPIQTYVMEYSDEIVREAIRREMARHGQVYYVYNRVSSISEIAARLQELVPEAQVTYAHGQMAERQLEKIMLDFVNGDIDVLVTTTIIETGLDIPNANTMIIHDADKLGLSQLYQIRGRVGRTNRTSYAFLMYRRDKLLKEEAEKRLSAIREFTELGSGIRIAMRDLEIRGAGNLLGQRQSGHIEDVGYDLYCKLLNEAVRDLRGLEVPDEDFETEVNCEVNAHIPATYIRNEYQRLDIYKRISAFLSHDDCLDMQDELIDRFGDMPKPVENLLLTADLKAAAHAAGVSVVTVNRQEIVFRMYPKAKINPAGIPVFLERHGKEGIRFINGERPEIVLIERREHYGDCLPMLKRAYALAEELAELVKEVPREADAQDASAEPEGAHPEPAGAHPEPAKKEGGK